LTERGWVAIGASAALAFLWIGLGELELLALAIVLGAAIIIGLILRRFAPPKVVLTRRLTPNMVHEGDYAIVETTITNRGRWRISNPIIEDEVTGLGAARFAASHLSRDSQATATYQILCRPRGVYEVGPASVTTSDPFGFTISGGPVGAADRLVVYPSTEELEGFPITTGRDPSQHAARPEFSHVGGEDFFTIREYQHGDDLRRVHWPTTARMDTIMIRQLETPWQSRALVLLDTRSGRYSDTTSFEKAVSGTASVVAHLVRSGFDTDMWAGTTAVATHDNNPFSIAMEALALVTPDERLDLRSAVGKLQRSGNGGTLVLVTGHPDAELFAAQQMLAQEYRSTILLSVEDAPSEATLLLERSGAVVVSIKADEAWAPAWLSTNRRSWSTA